MPLPASWVDALFGRLTVRWGAAFSRQYGDADPGAVKADWADVLGGLSGDAIAYALRYLPAEPCTATRFRDIARLMPPPTLPALTDDTRADPARVQSALATLQRPANTAMSPAQECAARLLSRAAPSGRMGAPQRHMLAAMAHAGLLTDDQRVAAAAYVKGLRPATTEPTT